MSREEVDELYDEMVNILKNPTCKEEIEENNKKIIREYYKRENERKKYFESKEFEKIMEGVKKDIINSVDIIYSSKTIGYTKGLTLIKSKTKKGWYNLVKYKTKEIIEPNIIESQMGYYLKVERVVSSDVFIIKRVPTSSYMSKEEMMKEESRKLRIRKLRDLKKIIDLRIKKELEE